MTTLFEEGRDYFRYRISVEPRFRFNDHFLLTYGINYDVANGDRGYATADGAIPIFGERNRQIVINQLSGSYNFNPFHTLALTFRHYWDTVDYDFELFTLLDNGRLTTNSGYTIDSVPFSPNINFSTWNLDLSYSWQFAPGSFLTALYRNRLFNRDDRSFENFSNSLETLFDQPNQHILSVRLQYFIDSRGIKSVFNRSKKDS